MERPSYFSLDDATLPAELQRTGYGFRQFEFSAAGTSAWRKLQAEWFELGPDQYLKSANMFRLRRYGQVDMVPSGQGVFARAERPYLQSQELNRYAGGVARSFAPLRPAMVESPLFDSLIRRTFDMFQIEERWHDRAWTVEVHLFRIRTEPGESAPPTPEGIHRDGFPFGAVILVDRFNAIGGETQIYTLDEQLLESRTLTRQGEALFAFDTRIKHYVTPVVATGASAYRDVLIFGYHLPGTPFEAG